MLALRLGSSRVRGSPSWMYPSALLISIIFISPDFMDDVSCTCFVRRMF